MQVFRCRSFCWLVGLIPAAALAGELPARFTLGKYVPADVWMYVHGVDNPERAWLDAKIIGLFLAAANAGIHRDTIALLVSGVPDDVRPKVQEIIDRIVSLTEQVGWFEICKEEFVFAERFNSGNFGAEYLALTRSDPSTAAKNFEAMSAILTEISRHNVRFDCVSANKLGVEVHSLRVRTGAGGFSAPFASLVRKHDVLGLVISPDDGGIMLREVRLLLAGDTKVKALASSERLRHAVADVDPPSDAIVFFDIHAFVESMHGTLQKLGHQRADNCDEAAGLAMSCKLLDALDVVEHVIVSESTRGERGLSSCVARLRQGKEQSPLVRALVDRKPFSKFDEFVPAEATAFMLETFVDVEAMYLWALDFIEKNAPDGRALVAKYKAFLTQLGFDPPRDFFSWWSGEMVSVSLPAAVVTPMGGGDSVWMFRVKNSELAAAKVKTAIDFVNAHLTGHGQGFVASPAPVQAEGFQQLTHPMVAMFLRPVIGVKDGWLMIGTSPQAVDKCLAVAAGKAPSIATNDRFRREGIRPDRPVLSLSFADTSKTGPELGQMAGMMGMMAGGIAASLPAEVPSEVRKLIQGATGIMTKLAPILSQIDFYSSTASTSRYDGGVFRTESVTTYKAPADAALKGAVHAESKPASK